MTPKVSVLVATYNRAALLPKSLDSIFAQTTPPSQVIVINDGSTDDTRRVLEAYGGKIESLEQRPNRGKSSALNLGMRRVTGDYVWIMDDDDLALPDALERHLEILERRPEVGFTYSGWYVPGDGGTRRIVSPPDPSDPELLIRLMRAFFLSLQGMLVRTSCYREVGLFDPELLRSQDYDMALRLLQRFPCARVEGPTYLLGWHPVPRGPAQDRFAFRELLLKANKYDKKIFRMVRRDLALHYYLPKIEDAVSTLTPCDTRRALLQRASILASKGLHKEMVEDLCLALAVPTNSALSIAERSILWEFQWCDDKAPPMFGQRRNRGVLHNASTIARSKTFKAKGVAFEIKLDLGRGLYWRAAKSWRVNDRLHAIVLLLSTCRIIGVRGMVQIALLKVVRHRAGLSGGGGMEIRQPNN